MNHIQTLFKNIAALKILAAITFVIMVACNALANILPINGMTTGQVSDSYPNLFAPAGYTFAVWGIIYALLAIFCTVQFFNHEKSNENVLRNILPYFIVSSVANTVWIFAWHFQIISVTVLLIIAILVCLIKTGTILANEQYTGSRYVWLRLPFTIYFGWITVATIANVTTFFVSLGWTGNGAGELWTVLVLLAGVAIAVMTARRLKDPAYLVVLAWAYGGILAKHIVEENGFNSTYPLIIITCAAAIGLFVGQALTIFLRSTSYRSGHKI